MLWDVKVSHLMSLLSVSHKMLLSFLMLANWHRNRCRHIESIIVSFKFIAVLNITESWLTTLGEEIIFRCAAEGFPDPQLLAWKTATLVRVLGNQTMTVTIRNDIKISTDTLIVMNNSICAEARAYSCVYSSGITLMESAMLDCPPGKND